MNERNQFATKIAMIFPFSPAARLSRLMGVKLRSAQYMINGDNQPPSNIEQWVENQVKLIHDFPLSTRLDALVHEALDVGIDKEVIASFLAEAHDALVRRPPE
jgi:hypothetical protein